MKRFGELDVEKRGFADMGPTHVNMCLLMAGSSAYFGKLYSYREPGRRKGNPGWDVCIGAIKYTIHYGNNPQTVESVPVMATDYERSMVDARLLDETLARLVEEKARNAKGTVGAPKL